MDSNIDVQSRFINALRSQAISYYTPPLNELERPVKRREGLPLLFQLGEKSTEVCTAYDTGTHTNHISLELATDIGYSVDTSSESQAKFQLPNDAIIKAVGRIAAEVQFVRGPKHETDTIVCQFNVFNELTVTVLMGSNFLQEPETITKPTSRLVDLSPGWKRSFRLCAVGNATNQVVCNVNGEDVLANADTGSEIVLVSAAYAAKYGLLQEYSCEELELADGTIVHTSGSSDVKFTVKTSEKSSNYNRRSVKPMYRKVRVHVLKSLHFDMILDEDIVDDFKIFEDGVSTLLSALADGIESLATIVHLGSTEQNIVHTAEKLKTWASSVFSSRKPAAADSDSNGKLYQLLLVTE
jgi:hypothetical protein